MKLAKVLVLLVLLSACSFTAALGESTIPPYHGYTDFLLASPGAMGPGLYGYTNPALLTYVHGPDLLFAWSDDTGEWNDFDRWGLFAGVPNLGFGAMHRETEAGRVTDYRLSHALGNRSASFGIGYGWSTGDTDIFNRTNVVTLGMLHRPASKLSIGISGVFSTSTSDREGVLDVAIRPLGDERLTGFMDYSLQKGETVEDAHWSIGAVAEVLPGLRLTGRYFDTEAFALGVSFSLGTVGISSQAHYDEAQDYSYATYGVRLGAYDRNVFDTYLMPKRNYVKLELAGQLKYRRYLLFDDSRTLSGLTSMIEAAKRDETVAGIAINASGMRGNRELIWEIREKLKDFKSSGKRVVIFIDNAEFPHYHFASVADRVVLDPTGSLMMQGIVFGRNYFKGSLEKMGVGFDEWRFFTYKSAYEGFSRESMSDADREQWQAIVDDMYETAKMDICESRGIAPEEFDHMVNEEAFFLPAEALERGLVDSLGRWESVENTIKDLEGKKKPFVSPGRIAQSRLPVDDHWGEKPQIAVVYALGECAMDKGIKARKLVKDVEAVTKNPQIRAVVVRVDSPGGDGTASDLVAEAMRKCAEKKPVIVSQGFVAGSGGYWLSMYGDTIVSAPFTLTGSVGVIGGWFYNLGLKEKLGMSTDFVTAGEHADLGFGATLPFINVTVPDRNLDEEERAKMEHAIRWFYDFFVEKVAMGRGKEFGDIEPIARGRVWSGADAKDVGLVDVLGGLETAVAIAKKKAGIPRDQDVTLVELPKPQLFDPNIFKPSLFGFEERTNELMELLKFRMEHNGQPLPMMSLDDMEMVMRLRQ
ncbi:MAG: S49 family peptidase [Candidatus Eiseniibacteriota bacterium]|nr:MAG: S49 family peptidase [Candidatus Eisenbacteria bacterium]